MVKFLRDATNAQLYLASVLVASLLLSSCASSGVPKAQSSPQSSVITAADESYENGMVNYRIEIGADGVPMRRALTESEQIADGHVQRDNNMMPENQASTGGLDCEVLHALTAEEKAQCLDYYTPSAEVLGKLNDVSAEKRFVIIEDEQLGLQNIPIADVNYTKHAEQKNKHNEREGDYQNNAKPLDLEVAYNIDLSQISNGVIAYDLTKKNKIVVDFREQNETIRLQNKTVPYAMIKLFTLKDEDNIVLSSIMRNGKGLLLDVVAIDSKGQTLAFLRNVYKKWSPETLFKYAKLDYVVDVGQLPKAAYFLLVFPNPEMLNRRIDVPNTGDTVHAISSGRLVITKRRH